MLDREGEARSAIGGLRQLVDHAGDADIAAFPGTRQRVGKPELGAPGGVKKPRRRRGLEGPDEELPIRLTVPRPAYTGTMAEAAGTRVAESAAPEPEVESAGEPTHTGGW